MPIPEKNKRNHFIQTFNFKVMNVKARKRK